MSGWEIVISCIWCLCMLFKQLADQQQYNQAAISWTIHCCETRQSNQSCKPDEGALTYPR